MKNAIDFLIDISDKMDKKVPIVQNVVIDGIVPNIDFSEPFGMRTFLSIVKSPIIINSLDMGSNMREDFVKKIQGLPFPNGGAPIAEAFKESCAGFKKFEKTNGEVTRRIVFVTNGEDTDAGVLDYEVEKATKDYPIQVNIIGICMSEANQRTAKKVADMTGGAFCNVEQTCDVMTLRGIIAPVIDALHNAISAKAPEPAPAPQPAPPAPAPEPITAKIPEPEPVRVKEEPIRAAFVSQPVAQAPKPAAQAPVQQEKKEEPAFSSIAAEVIEPVFDIEKENEYKAEIAAIAELQAARSAQKSANVKAIEESNSNIVALLGKNKAMMDQILEGGKETEIALDRLRAAVKDHEMTIEELRTVNKKLTEQNLQLKHRAKEQEANLEALKQEKMALQKEIDRVREIANEMLKI
ncbi:MAG: hypothetical protein IKP27_08965 [Paludibacteraceae bacterium]|nr:hypothetical protein [Paludibacteraceae bacterium]